MIDVVLYSPWVFAKALHRQKYALKASKNLTEF